MRPKGQKLINRGLGVDPYEPQNPLTPGTGDAGYVDIQELARTNPELALQYAGEDPGAVPDFSGLSQRDWAQVESGVGDTIAKLNQPPADPNEQRFGNDLAWLDSMFQQDPTEALNQAKQFGTAADPGAQAQQQKVLDELMGIYSQGGLGAQDRAARAQARAESENWLKGQRDASRQSLAQRGMLGSGAELALELGDSQGAASRLSAADLQTSADAERRAMDALRSGGELSTEMRRAGDAFQQNNANMIAAIGGANKDFVRKAYGDMINRRDNFQQNELDRQTDLSKFLADLDARENAAGWQFGYNTAAGDTAGQNQAQSNFNNATQGAFTGQTGNVRAAGVNQIATKGEEDAASGRAFTGAANFVGNLFGSLYGGGGGGGQQQQSKSSQQPLASYGSGGDGSWRATYDSKKGY